MRKPEYTDHHATCGLSDPLPELEAVLNQFLREREPYHAYEVKLIYPEFSSVCPRTGLPDTGTITVIYTPHQHLVEMKSLKVYLVGYRNIGIFQENAVNRILRDFVHAVKPTWAKVTGEFTPRGGMRSVIEARYGD